MNEVVCLPLALSKDLIKNGFVVDRSGRQRNGFPACLRVSPRFEKQCSLLFFDQMKGCAFPMLVNRSLS